MDQRDFSYVGLGLAFIISALLWWAIIAYLLVPLSVTLLGEW